MNCNCPHCRAFLTVHNRFMGQLCDCPQCKKQFKVPDVIPAQCPHCKTTLGMKLEHFDRETSCGTCGKKFQLSLADTLADQIPKDIAASVSAKTMFMCVGIWIFFALVGVAYTLMAMKPDGKVYLGLVLAALGPSAWLCRRDIVRRTLREHGITDEAAKVAAKKVEREKMDMNKVMRE